MKTKTDDHADDIRDRRFNIADVKNRLARMTAPHQPRG